MRDACSAKAGEIECALEDRDRQPRKQRARADGIKCISDTEVNGNVEGDGGCFAADGIVGVHTSAGEPWYVDRNACDKVE